MEPQEIKQILAIDQENNAILKKLLRAQVIQNWLKAAYIIIVVGFVYGGYVFLKPMLTNLIGTYQNVFNMSNQLQNSVQGEASINMDKFNKILKTLK